MFKFSLRHEDTYEVLTISNLPSKPKPCAVVISDSTWRIVERSFRGLGEKFVDMFHCRRASALLPVADEIASALQNAGHPEAAQEFAIVGHCCAAHPDGFWTGGYEDE